MIWRPRNRTMDRFLKDRRGFAYLFGDANCKGPCGCNPSQNPCNICNGAIQNVSQNVCFLTFSGGGTSSLEFGGFTGIPGFQAVPGQCVWTWGSFGHGVLWVVYCQSSERYFAYDTGTDAYDSSIDSYGSLTPVSCTGASGAFTPMYGNDVTGQFACAPNGKITAGFTLAWNAGSSSIAYSI